MTLLVHTWVIHLTRFQMVYSTTHNPSHLLCVHWLKFSLYYLGPCYTEGSYQFSLEQRHSRGPCDWGFPSKKEYFKSVRHTIKLVAYSYQLELPNHPPTQYFILYSFQH